MPISYNPIFVSLSFAVAIFASFVTLSMSDVIAQARGKAWAAWLACGAFAMGFGIWSMHFIGMLAFEMPGMSMGYDVPLLGLSIAIPIVASALALFIVSRPVVGTGTLVAGGVAMAAAIAGMHYTGMFSMRMSAHIEWNLPLVFLSILIALFASFFALTVSLRLRGPARSVRQLVFGSLLLGAAIAGMHYTGMMAATFVPGGETADANDLVASSGLGVTVITVTLVLLGIALLGSVLDRGRLIEIREQSKTNERLYRETQEALAALKEERELRRLFVSGLAHDLRGPLTSAMTSLQLCMVGGLSPEAKVLCERAQKGMIRIDQMVRDLLDVASINIGQSLPLRLEPFDLTALLKEVIEDLSGVHGDHFKFEGPEKMRGCWDRRYLQRLTENLCSNAVKYGRPDTPIIIRLETYEQEGVSKVSLSINNQNRGAPIPPKELEALFQVFRRGSTGTASGHRGWGLGLTIVRGVALSHGGSVRVTSTEGEGTTFVTELPLDARGFVALKASS